MPPAPPSSSSTSTAGVEQPQLVLAPDPSPASAPTAVPTLPDQPWEKGYASKVTDWLWIGGALTGPEMLTGLVARGVTHVLSVAEEHDDRPYTDPVGVISLHIPWADDPEHPQPKPLVDFYTVLGWVLNGDRSLALQDTPLCVYVHCDSGKHRSALMTTFLLAVFEGLGRRAAYAQVKTAHPQARMWHLKPYRRSLKRAVPKARSLLQKVGTTKQGKALGPLATRALARTEAREEQLTFLDTAVDAEDRYLDRAVEAEQAEQADQGRQAARAALDQNDRIVRQRPWDPRDMPIDAPISPNETDPFLPWDANPILNWLVVGAHIRGGDSPDETLYGDDGDLFVQWLAQIGITHILNVCAEHDDDKEAGRRQLATFKLWWPDDDETPAPYLPPLQDFVAALRWVLDALVALSSAGRRLGLYVHCHGGKHRAPLMATVLIALLCGLPTDAAYALLKRRRTEAELVETIGYAAHASVIVEALRPYINPRNPINALPALSVLAGQLPPVLDHLPPGYSFDDQGRTVAHVGGQTYKSDLHPHRGHRPEGAGAAREETDLDAADARQTLAGPLSAYQMSDLERQTLQAQLYAAMRSAFLARWAELGMVTVQPPKQALAQLAEDARFAADSATRTHNRGITRIAGETAAHTSATTTGELHQALHSAVGEWLCTNRAPATTQMAAYECGRAQQYADLYAGGQGASARYAVVTNTNGTDGSDLRDDEALTCASCRAYLGRTLTASEAWQFIRQQHPGCSHRVHLLQVAPEALRSLVSAAITR